MRSRSPRFSLSMLLCASLAVVGCGDSSNEGSTGTGTKSKTSTGTKPAGTKDTKTSSGSATGDKSTNTGDTKSKDKSGTTSSKTDGPKSSGTASGTGKGSGTGNGSGTGKGSGTGNGSGTGTGTGNGSVKVTLTKDVQPIFNDVCGCHTKDNAPAGDLNLKAGAAYGSLIGKKSAKTGKPFVTANDVSKSYLYGTLTHKLSVKMPTTKLPADKLKVFEDWINAGAPE